MITNAERTQLRQILQDPRWRTIETLANSLCAMIRDNTAVKDTEWETLQTLLTNEGEVRGIKRLIKEVYEQASQEK